MEDRREAYRRIEEAAAQRFGTWPAWKQNATQVPVERRNNDDHGQPEPRRDPERRSGR
jgi:hypothetical protein